MWHGEVSIHSMQHATHYKMTNRSLADADLCLAADKLYSDWTDKFKAVPAACKC